MKVEKLAGRALHYWVARAEGRKLELRPVPLGKRNASEWFVANDAGDWFFELEYWKPSENPAHGWPIADRERIELVPLEGTRLWEARKRSGAWPFPLKQRGRTSLLAAMRVFVASRFGAEVPDEPGAPQGVAA